MSLTIYEFFDVAANRLPETFFVNTPKEERETFKKEVLKLETILF